MLEKAGELKEILLRKFHDEEVSQEQAQQLEELYQSSGAYRNLYEELSRQGAIEDLLKEYWDDLEYFDPAKKDVEGKGKLISSKFLWRISAAASVFLILAIGAYFWFNEGISVDKSVSNVPIEKPTDLSPGKHKAILTLASGRKIIIDSASSGELASQGNAKVLSEGGHIIYSATDGPTDQTLYNVLTTAKGEIYSLVLSDGSRAWLNATSSIRFPVEFKGTERRVKITGEVYFEVTHNKFKPFKVEVDELGGKGVEIEVLGTAFNINSYADEESIKTTLLEGSVKIKIPNGPVSLLKPGQQSEAKDGVIRAPKTGDLQQAVAWKNGYFQFNRDDIYTVMRQLARWYDVEVVFEGNVPKGDVWGKIHRNTKASEVLKILEKSDIHFRIEGKKIIVTP